MDANLLPASALLGLALALVAKLTRFGLRGLFHVV